MTYQKVRDHKEVQRFY